MKGQKLLVKQLEWLHDQKLGFETEDILDSMPNIEILAAKCQVPNHLRQAFNGYAAEFLKNPCGCIAEDGIYFSDELELTIIEKIRNFFDPIAMAVKELYPGIKVRSTIEPSYQDCSSIVITATYDHPYLISQDIIIYYENLKIWNLWYSDVEGLYLGLEQIYKQMVDNIQKAMLPRSYYTALNTMNYLGLLLCKFDTGKIDDSDLIANMMDECCEFLCRVKEDHESGLNLAAFQLEAAGEIEEGNHNINEFIKWLRVNVPSIIPFYQDIIKSIPERSAC